VKYPDGDLCIRAALAGRTISDYLLDEVLRSLERPTRQELEQRIAQRTAVLGSESSEDAVRAERDSR
jgi:ATP/maltotriose-dependent transcriptional regulator MalT